MKLLLVIIAGSICCSVVAQQKNVSISHSINDDGKTLSIKIKGTVDDKPVDYNNSFNVTGMTKEQRDGIKKHIYDSLGLPDPVGPVAPLAPEAALHTVMIAPTHPSPGEPATPPVVASKSQYAESYSIGGDHPYTKEIKYNPKTGMLFMKYRFVKNGEETTAEKSVDAKDKSSEEREQLIKRYEKEIGVARPAII